MIIRDCRLEFKNFVGNDSITANIALTRALIFTILTVCAQRALLYLYHFVPITSDQSYYLTLISAK